jgi:ribosome recycling factor
MELPQLLNYRNYLITMTIAEQHIKDLESELTGIVQRLKTDFSGIRGNRPSPEMLQDVRVNVYDQSLTIRELGSLTVVPPRMLQVTLWDKEAVLPVVKAIEAAHLGLTVSNDGTTIRATLSALGNERREELMKLVKKTAEAARIQIRGKREETIKRLKDAEGRKEITEDDSFRAKEKIQKIMDRTNGEVETMAEKKFEELGEG